jgi:hypothetical protein
MFGAVSVYPPHKLVSVPQGVVQNFQVKGPMTR